MPCSISEGYYIASKYKIMLVEKNHDGTYTFRYENSMVNRKLDTEYMEHQLRKNKYFKIGCKNVNMMKLLYL